MKLLLDENLSRRLVSFLQHAYPGTSQVVLLGLESASDREVWQKAKDDGYVIVTRDADFQELAGVGAAAQGGATAHPEPDAGRYAESAARPPRTDRRIAGNPRSGVGRDHSLKPRRRSLAVALRHVLCASLQQRAFAGQL